MKGLELEHHMIRVTPMNTSPLAEKVGGHRTGPHVSTVHISFPVVALTHVTLPSKLPKITAEPSGDMPAEDTTGAARWQRSESDKESSDRTMDSKSTALDLST